MDFLGEKALDKFPDCTNGRLAATRGSPSDVREAFARHGLLDDRVQLLQGWFDATLPTAPIQNLAVLRLDGDFFKSTMDGLRILYPKLSPGGFCIVDDYHAFPVRALLSAPRVLRCLCAHSGPLRACSVVVLGEAPGNLSPKALGLVLTPTLALTLTQECARACTEYREAHGITAEIVDIDDEGVYWRK